MQQQLATRPTTLPGFLYNDVYEVPLPDGHRFPMQKYRHARVQLQQQLDGGSSSDSSQPLATFEVSPLATMQELATTHDEDYVRRYLAGEFTARENRVVGFPWSEASVQRSLSSVGGTLAAARRAMAAGGPRITGHLAGGTHHAFHSHGEGFCVFSDIAVATNVLLRELQDEEDPLERVLIVDLDVHQGNGNAVLLQNEHRAFTFSVQCRENLFSTEQHSDLDVYLTAGDGDDAYMAALTQHLPQLFAQFEPQLVFFQAGVDPIATDRLGRLALSREGLRARNKMVFDLTLNAANQPRLVVTFGGGYPTDLDPRSVAFQGIVEAHIDVYSGAAHALAEHSLRTV
jgi:acetoin utilization deacetylase AcuC-like enzyme